MSRDKQQPKCGSPGRASTTGQAAGSNSNTLSQTPIQGVGVEAGTEQQLGRDARNAKAEHVLDIDVKMEGDYFQSDITGCALLSDNKLVIVDNLNVYVKLIDLEHNTLQGNIELPYIWDITRVGNTQVAVTSYRNQTIHFLNVNTELKMGDSVKVKGECRGISCLNDRLVVSYTDPVKVEILSMDGQVLHVVVAEQRAMELFVKPLHVVVSRDQKALYITDGEKDTVTNLSLTGELIATFQSDEFVNPRGLAVDKTGDVYVCGFSSSTLVQLTAELTQPRRLLQESDGLIMPRSICFSEATDRVYIGMFHSNYVKVFQLKT